MSLGDDLRSDVSQILKYNWTTRKGQKVPETSDLKLANDAIELEATVLYADMSGSTKLVDRHKPLFAAEIYKCYLRCAAKIIRSEGGVITSYDGDRIMVVFIGGYKNTSAVRAGLKINYATQEIVNPAIKVQYNTEYQADQTVGIDTSKLSVARIGIRGSNDLVWIGRAANYSAKLTELSTGYHTWITSSVYKKLDKSLKNSIGKQIWNSHTWTTMNDHPVYGSSWWVEL